MRKNTNNKVRTYFFKKKKKAPIHITNREKSMDGNLEIGMGKYWGKHNSLVPTRVETVAVEVNRGLFRLLEQWLLVM